MGEVDNIVSFSLGGWGFFSRNFVSGGWGGTMLTSISDRAEFGNIFDNLYFHIKS